MESKYAWWIVGALVFYVLFKDQLFGEGGISGSFAAGTRYPSPGPSPMGVTWANVPPAPSPATNKWDFFSTVVNQLPGLAAAWPSGGGDDYSTNYVNGLPVQ